MGLSWSDAAPRAGRGTGGARGGARGRGAGRRPGGRRRRRARDRQDVARHALPRRRRGRRARAVRHLRRPLDPAPARSDPRPGRDAVSGARGDAGGRGRTARDPATPARRARAPAADGAGARGRALGRRGDARRDHPARPPHRLAARAAPAHLAGRRGAGRAPGARSGRGDSVVVELEPLSESAVASLSGDGADAVYAATGGNPFYVTELLASRTDEELPRSITNAVRGRVSRLSDEERRLVELVSVVPNRVATSVLDAVLPDWPPAAEEPERRALLEVAPPLRALPARARTQRDPVEHPDRRAPPAARGDPRSAARRGRRPRRHRPPRRGGGGGERRRRLRARGGAAGGGARLEPRGVLPLPTCLGVPRSTLRARAGRGARGARGRGLRGLQARRRFRRDQACDRRVDRAR